VTILRSYELRPVAEADRDFLARVYASTRTEELAATSWSEDEKASFLRQQFEAQDRHYRAHYRDTSYDVILVDGRPAGRLYVARWQEEIRLVDVSLLPEFRGRGVGTQILEAVLTEGRARGRPVRIHVESFNQARRLYERLGFRAVADRGVYVMMEWSADQAVTAP
jgi:GNAT superfamily N-acetyltransferase